MSPADVRPSRTWGIHRVLSVTAVATLALVGAAAPIAGAAAPRDQHLTGANHSQKHRTRSPRSSAHHRRTKHRTLAHAANTTVPVLRVSGTRLTWNPLRGVSRWNLATIRFIGSTRHTSYRYVTGTNFKPPAAPGESVKYGLEANLPNAPWSPEVSIKWPANNPPPPSPAPPPAPAPSSAFVKGVNVDPAGWGPAAESQIASEMTDLGAGWARVDLSWAATEKSPGVYDWSHMDADVAAANAHGIHLLPVVGYAPSWTTPQDAQGYASFVAAAVKRYGPGTSANLTWFELWNEPNYAYAWSGGVSQPGAYAKDVRAAAQAAKQVAPSVKVLMYADYEDSPQTGGSSPWQTTMIDDYFAAVPDLAKWIDGIAVHPYGSDPSLPLANSTDGWKDGNGDWAFARVDQIHSKFLAHGLNVPMWITEVGWSTYTYSASQQAAYYRNLIGAVQRRPWIRAMFSYCLREWESNPTNDQSGYGLLSYPSWQPKPAYQELKSGFATLA